MTRNCDKLVCLFLCLVISYCATSQPDLVIGFGSCNKHDQPQPLWKEILKHNPALWVWLGDNIYADTGDTTIVNEMYRIQKAHPVYHQLCSRTTVIGIWDDHDYGKNNAGKEFKYKDAMKEAMLDFLEVPEYAPVRKRPGAYQSYTIGTSPKRVKVVLLDVRYFRDPIERKQGAYVPNEAGTLLGEAQWLWLEEELSDPEIDLFIIGSGIQIIPEDHKYEKWANFPNERKKLLGLLTNQASAPALLLSGDRHIGEISTMKFSDLPYPIVEITSSGLTHAWFGNTSEKNRHRHGEIADEFNFGILRIAASPDGALSVDAEIRGRDDNLLESISIAFPGD